jgi:hypothetical protein
MVAAAFKSAITRVSEGVVKDSWCLPDIPNHNPYRPTLEGSFVSGINEASMMGLTAQGKVRVSVHDEVSLTL